MRINPLEDHDYQVLENYWFRYKELAATDDIENELEKKNAEGITQAIETLYNESDGVMRDFVEQGYFNAITREVDSKYMAKHLNITETKLSRMRKGLMKEMAEIICYIWYQIFLTVEVVILQQKKPEWQLSLLAKALTRMRRLEKLRSDFHEELYSCIIYPSVQLDQTLERKHSHATDSQAIRIIEAKERYERLIHKEYERHVRWRTLLEWLNENDQIIMIRYFEKKKTVQPKIMSRLLSKIEQRLELEERRIEQERTDKATVDYELYQQQTQAFRKVHIPVDDGQARKQYLIDGSFIRLTAEEYQAMTWKLNS